MARPRFREQLPKLHAAIDPLLDTFLLLLHLLVELLLDPFELITANWSTLCPTFAMTKFDPKVDIPDLTGKVILVTGGMSPKSPSS